MSRPAAWWRDIATNVAIVGLLVTLVFNTFTACGQLEQSHRDAEQATETRRYTQIGVLTQLAGEARQSDRVIESGNLPALRCKGDYTISDLSVRDEAALREALGVYDYLAWLFNEGHVGLSSARSVWAPRMIDAAQLGSKLLSERDVAINWPELARFRAHANRVPRPQERCPEPAPRGSG